MTTTTSRPREVILEPGWLQRQLDDVAALGRANRKIIAAADKARSNGHTQPVKLELSMPELQALAYMARFSGVR